jgi:Zn-dependent peptidase ImmA (M78 family)
LIVFERGFKSWCESYSVQRRQDMGLASHEPLGARELAAHLGIRVWAPSDVPGLNAETLAVLLRNDGVTPSCWSAVTLIVGSKKVIILNTSHSLARQSSDLMHELAHLIRGHNAQEVDVSEEGLMLLKDYDKQYEEEADWLAGCLLLPRDALLHIKRRRLGSDEAATTYGVSQRMLSYRIAVSGVGRQVA